MVSKHVFLGFVLLCIPTLVSAQIATPPIDPGSPVLAASASSWRFGTSIGVGSQYGYQATDVQKNKSQGAGSYGVIVFQPTHVSTELYSMSGDKRSVWDSTSDILHLQSVNESRVGMAVRGDGRVSVGLGIVQRDSLSRGVSRLQKGFGGSFGFRLGEGFFVGLGVNRMRETVAKVSDKQWSERLAGVALVYGDPDSSMFRIEGGSKSSPLVAKGTTLAEVHHQQTEQFVDLEILLSRWFASAKVTDLKQFAALPNEKDQQIKRIKYGLGYRKLSFSFILYRILVDKKRLSSWYKERYLQATMSIGFF